MHGSCDVIWRCFVSLTGGCVQVEIRLPGHHASTQMNTKILNHQNKTLNSSLQNLSLWAFLIFSRVMFSIHIIIILTLMPRPEDVKVVGLVEGLAHPCQPRGVVFQQAVG